ncbi:SGNH hydrolase [Didymella exigua CBS 183.55]|uniref:SGNH hydrolase n=1 Tax=Didymella exigua CBS 183.55 TaxID=1150837 RepID=A0A6A5RCF0_9PLEO|nr:SGNH hydrolase [Didymella exigua CBS 183.55]KAF1924296.1 SGNH hydrolase [Didymella exigua CBS 183.55]
MTHFLPQFILFGASMIEWGFQEETEGLGWFLQDVYRDRISVKNEGKQNYSYTSTRLLPAFDRIIAQATSPNAPRTLLFIIFLGANDACFVGNAEYVALPTFEANIRKLVETILVQDVMTDTKIVLITPPPINIPAPDAKGKEGDEIRTANEVERKKKGYRTYMSKKRYAERVMQIAREYEETTRVIGVNFWDDLIRTRLQEFDEGYDDEKLPGSGLYGARDFGEGYFTDGLHLDKKGYTVLSKGLYEAVLARWPGLAPDRL